MASSITLSADLEIDSLTVTTGASFNAAGYDVAVGDVSIDAPYDIILGNGSTWTVSGSWVDGAVASHLWTYNGSTVIFTGVDKVITKPTSTQFFYNMTIASGASYSSATHVLASYGDMHIYGTYVGATAKYLGCYYGSGMYLHDGSSVTLPGTGTLYFYGYFGGGGLVLYHPTAVLSVSQIVFTYADVDTKFVPGDYGDASILLNGGSSMGCDIYLDNGVYNFKHLILATNGTSYGVKLDTNSDAEIHMTGNISTSGVLVSTYAQIDNSGGSTNWYIYGNVDCTQGGWDIEWIPGTGLIELDGGTNQTFDFAGATTELINCNKTAGNVTLNSGVHDIVGDFPADLIVDGADISGYPGEVISVRGDFAISSGDWTVGSGTDWRYYGDVDWSGVGTMDHTNSTMSCYDDGTWTWKDNLNTSAPWGLLIKQGKTLTAENSTGTYSYVSGQFDIYGTLLVGASVIYFVMYNKCDMRVHKYGTLNLTSKSLFAYDPFYGITKMDGTFTSDTGARNILWYVGNSASVIAPGTYNVSLYIYGSASRVNMDPEGTYVFTGALSTVPTAGGNLYIKLGEYVSFSYVYWTINSLNGTIHMDLSDTKRMYLQYAECSINPTTTNVSKVNWTYDTQKSAIEFINTASHNIHMPKVTAKSAPPIIINGTGASALLTMSYHDLECYRLSVLSGQLNTNTLGVTTDEDIIIGSDGSLIEAGLAGVTLTAGGSFSMAGSPGDLLDVTSAADWTVAATQGCTAYYTNLSHCIASVHPGSAFGSIDSGDNVNWSFGSAENELKFPDTGINFIIHTLQDLDIDASAYALGFYGAGEDEYVYPGEYQSKTFLVDKDGTLGEVQCRNVKYDTDTTAYVDHILEPVPIKNIPNYLGTMNIRLIQLDDVFVALAEAKFYNGYDDDIPPDGMDIKVVELRHVGERLNDNLGHGSKAWFNAENGDWFRLTQSPGERGVKSNSVGVWVGPRHDWYLAISVSPHDVGSRVFGMKFRAEFI